MRAICKETSGRARTVKSSRDEPAPNVYKGPNQCPECGIKYDDYRTGLDFAGVREMLWRTSEDSSKWKYKRRGSVLGLWHEMKGDLWEEHLDTCEGVLEETEDEFDFPVYEDSF